MSETAARLADLERSQGGRARQELLDALLRQRGRLERALRALAADYDALYAEYVRLKTKQTAVEREYQLRLLRAAYE